MNKQSNSEKEDLFNVARLGKEPRGPVDTPDLMDAQIHLQGALPPSDRLSEACQKHLFLGEGLPFGLQPLPSFSVILLGKF